MPGPLPRPPRWAFGSWPPSIEEARERIGNARDRRGHAKTRPYLLYPLACALIQHDRSSEALVEALSLLTRACEGWSRPEEGWKRAAAWQAAGVAVQCLGGQAAAALAMDMLRSVTAELEGSLLTNLQGLAAHVLGIRSRTAALEPLDWDAHDLVPKSRRARARLLASPPVPVEGTWGGVRGVLVNWGMAAPQACPLEGPVLLRRNGAPRFHVQPLLMAPLPPVPLPA